VSGNYKRDMKKQRVWEIIDKKSIPKERSLIENKWVFKQKKNGIYRARLVALGYSQILGVDFSKNYTPVINDITMRTMLVLKMANSWANKTIDVETAFLYGNLTEEIYMIIPNGLEEYLNQQLSDKCVKLKKVNLWINTSSKSLVETIYKFTTKIGFKKCLSDNCLMMRINEAGILILCIYVDNVCVFGVQ
jgi:Reverse transcriptase (RNA-dependent DNA polymerase)